jgi:hypothetical protein
LLFGSSQASREFRKGKLCSQIKRDFNYKIPNMSKIEDLPAGALIFACVSQFKIDIVVSSQLRMNQFSAPFQACDVITFNILTKTFKFKKLDLINMCNYYSKYRADKQYLLAMKL